MLKLQVPVNDQFAFSQETAARLANILSRYDSSIMIHDENRMINAKSLLGILSLGYLQSSALEFIIDGIDEETVFHVIQEYFQS